MQKQFLSTHYYFDDETHSMDAFILNKCDKEIIDSILLIADLLKIKDDLKLEKLANKKGSLVDWYQTLIYSDKIGTTALFVSLITLYFTIFPKKSKTEKDILELKKIT